VKMRAFSEFLTGFHATLNYDIVAIFWEVLYLIWLRSVQAALNEEKKSRTDVRLFFILLGLVDYLGCLLILGVF